MFLEHGLRRVYKITDRACLPVYVLAWIFPLRWNKNSTLQAGCWMWLYLATFRDLAWFQIRMKVWEWRCVKELWGVHRLTQSILSKTQALDRDCQEHGKQLLTCSNSPYRLLQQWDRKYPWKNKQDTANSALFSWILSWTYRCGEILLSAEKLEMLHVKTKFGPSRI